MMILNEFFTMTILTSSDVLDEVENSSLVIEKNTLKFLRKRVTEIKKDIKEQADVSYNSFHFILFMFFLTYWINWGRVIFSL